MSAASPVTPPFRRPPAVCPAPARCYQGRRGTRVLSPRGSSVVRARRRQADAAAARRLAQDFRGREHAHRRADRLRQDARGVPRGPSTRWSGTASTRRARRRDAFALRLAAEGARATTSRGTSRRRSKASAELRGDGPAARRRFARRCARATRRARIARGMTSRPPHILVTTPSRSTSCSRARAGGGCSARSGRSSSTRSTRSSATSAAAPRALARAARRARRADPFSASASRRRSTRSKSVARFLVGSGEGRPR